MKEWIGGEPLHHPHATCMNASIEQVDLSFLDSSTICYEFLKVDL